MHCVEFCDLYFGNFSLVNPALSEMEAILHQPGSVSRWPSRDATRQGITEAVADRWQVRRAGSSGNGGCRPQKTKEPRASCGALDGMRPGSACGSDVQQIVIGEFGLVRDEREARFGLGAHQPLHRIRRGVAVV